MKRRAAGVLFRWFSDYVYQQDWEPRFPRVWKLWVATGIPRWYLASGGDDQHKSITEILAD